jgi:uncharacterized protein with GYD domain
LSKFLIEASYTTEGLQGLQRDKASSRVAAVAQAAQSLGGSLESMHFALGADDVIVIVDLPSASAVASLSTAISASGLARTRTTALLTATEMDEALGRHPDYRGPGQQT